MAIMTGLRAGELVSLHDRDVHLDAEPYLEVRYGGPPKVHLGGVRKLPTPKWGSARRVPLTAAAVETLREWMAFRATWRHGGEARLDAAGITFPRRRGGYRSPVHVIPWATWKAAQRKAGLSRHVRWHDLRHTFGTSLVCGWWGRRWSLEEVQRVMGHRSRAMTERYATVAPSAVQAAAAETAGPSFASATQTKEPPGPLSIGTPEGNRIPDPRFRKAVESALGFNGLDGSFASRLRALADAIEGHQ